MQFHPGRSTDFSLVHKQAKAIQAEVAQLDRLRAGRARVFKGCMEQYKRYVKKENELLDRNARHCEARNIWYRQEVGRAWRIAVADRAMVLRSVARTNVHKKDVDEWLERVERGVEGEKESSRVSMGESMEGSQLIDRYNQILQEYGHKL